MPVAAPAGFLTALRQRAVCHWPQLTWVAGGSGRVSSRVRLRLEVLPTGGYPIKIASRGAISLRGRAFRGIVRERRGLREIRLMKVI